MSSFLKHMETRFQLFESKSKPDYIDLDGDGDTTEPMKKAAADRKKVNEEPKPDYIDLDGDGDTSEPMKKAAKDKLHDSVECDRCNGKGCDHCDGKGYHEKVDEMSTTAGVPAPPHKYAFGKKKKKYSTNSTGYSVVEEALERQYEKLIEGYRSYVTDNPKMSSEAKVKNTIREVSKRLKEIEEMVGNASRLKTESGMSRDGYGKQVNRALNTISEKLIKISERVRSLGE